jgi:hypothetical protein
MTETPQLPTDPPPADDPSTLPPDEDGEGEKYDGGDIPGTTEPSTETSDE